MATRKGEPDDFATFVPRDFGARSFVLGGDEFVVFEVSTKLPPLGSLLDSLTSAELQVAQALLSGESNAVIARSRQTAVRTVANQVASIYRKLGVASRAEFYALRPGRRSG